ncbi:MAG TPA: hypothetical protein V6D19_09285 [Stenomitos sp.]
MLSPDDIIGQQVWLEVPRDADYPTLDPYRVKATITQPTSPPWFYARYDNPPPVIRATGQWLSLKEAQDAVLYNPVFEEDELGDEDWNDWADEEDELNLK